MAKIASSFKCLICKQPLNFPENIGIVEFIIIMLQFYKTHELCETLENRDFEKKDVKVKSKQRRKRGE